MRASLCKQNTSQNNTFHLAPFPEPPFSPAWLGFIPPAKRSPRPGPAFPPGPPFPLPGGPGGPLANRAARPAGPLLAATPFSSFVPSASWVLVCLLVGFGAANLTLSTSTHPFGVDTLPPTTGALMSTVICFFNPASVNPPFSSTRDMTPVRVSSSSSFHFGFSVFASFKPLSSTIMGPRLPAMVSILRPHLHKSTQIEV